ncbi:MAG TPA: hypothetical protein PLI43_03030 [Albidovulum sp.]|uniref:hypothetical protein n=1 Tax=Albidovulum sp. TaxID=1872424 RepID=UPI002CF97A53|nr:hypothetical protein [Albidovulum sp.]
MTGRRHSTRRPCRSILVTGVLGLLEMFTDSYGYRSQARRPVTYLALGVAMMVVYLCITLDMGQLLIALALVYLALVLRRLWLNPIKGFRLGRGWVEIYRPRGVECINFTDVASVTVCRTNKGQTACFLNMETGDVLPLPGAEKLEFEKLIGEFGLRGVRVLV